MALNRLGHIVKRFLYSNAMGEMLITAENPASGSIYLTFDDGPHPINTRRILDILRSSGVRATFFLSGEELAKYPEIAPRYVQEGHTIANHGYFHERKRYTDRKSVEREFFQAQTEIERVCNVSPIYFRPPYGTLNFAVAKFSLRNRVPVVLWSVDSHDDGMKDAKRIMSSLETVVPGDIVLLHEDCSQMIDILEEWIRVRKETGMRFAPLGGMS
ncbi:MAG: polysaccharide deacetylase family protein [Candidatus Aminicenantes bacterium]|nr:MAG: polysaccharide deacetylase family protein [Candidatus Aminicenantes bacterium]